MSPPAETRTAEPTADVRAITERLRTRVAQLAERPVAEVPTGSSLASLGLDSIVVIELQALVEAEWSIGEVRVTPGDTIDDVAARVGAELQAGPVADPAQASASSEGELATGGADAPESTFPALPLQRAYLVGRREDVPLGGVAAHMYLELDSAGLDLARLERALRRLIAHHEMLRTIVHPDGTLETLPAVPDFGITAVDLRDLGDSERQERLDQLRSERAHRMLPLDRAPLMEVGAAWLADDRLRLFVYLDFLVADAMSCLSLLREWGELYRDPAAELPRPRVSFAAWSRDQVAASARAARAREYWAERAKTLPPAPRLPLSGDPTEIVGAHFDRERVELDAATWSALKERAASSGLTPSIVLGATYAEALAAESEDPAFTLTLTLFNRPRIEGIEHVVGDFSSTSLLSVDAARPSFAALCQAMQDRLWLDLQHRAVSGVETMRSLWRSGGAGRVPLMPVVFTSLLEDLTGFEWLGENVYGISETPQVYLDHQAFERAGALLLQFDYVRALLEPDLIQRMAGRQRERLEALARDGGAW